MKVFVSGIPAMVERETPWHQDEVTTFHGRVDEQEPGRFLATCYAKRDRLPEVQEQEPDRQMFDSRVAAEDWIKMTAAARGFKSVKMRQKRTAL